MTDDALHDHAVDAFIAAADTGDETRRATLLSRALTADVVFWGPLGRGVGRTAVEDFITEVVQRHPSGPCRMVRTTRVDAPGEWARFGWRYEDASGNFSFVATTAPPRAPGFCCSAPPVSCPSCGRPHGTAWTYNSSTSPASTRVP